MRRQGAEFSSKLACPLHGLLEEIDRFSIEGEKEAHSTPIPHRPVCASCVRDDPDGSELAATVITCDFPSAAKAAVARLIGTDGAQEVNLAKGRPQHIRKVELTMHALPKEET